MSEAIHYEAWRAGTLSEAQMRQLAELHMASFGSKGRTVEEYVSTRLRQMWAMAAEPASSSAVMHVVHLNGQPVAKAASWVHAVGTQDGPLKVLALAGVASHPRVRGRGFGKVVAELAFARVREGDAPVCLFQTGSARGFYERLGCQVVDNRFINSLDPATPDARPWWDEVVMIYPAGASAWPPGTVDLMGPAW